MSNFEEVKKRDWSEYVGIIGTSLSFHVPKLGRKHKRKLQHKSQTRQWRLELLEFHWVWLKMKDIWDLTITWSPKCGYFRKFNRDIQMSKDWFQASFNHQLLFSVSLHSSSNFERKRRVAWCLKIKNNQAVWSTKLGEWPHVTQICNQTMGNSMNRTWRFDQRKRKLEKKKAAEFNRYLNHHDIPWLESTRGDIFWGKLGKNRGASPGKMIKNTRKLTFFLRWFSHMKSSILNRDFPASHVWFLQRVQYSG